MKRLFLIPVLLFIAGCYYKKSPEMRLCTRLDWQSVVDIFPKNKHEIGQLANRSIGIMKEMLDQLQDIDATKYTFHNSVRVYDNAKFKFVMNLQILSTLATLSQDHEIRTAAHHAVEKLQQYQADNLIRNPILLKVFQNYVRYGTDDQSKTILTRSFLEKSINRLEHEGANSSKDVAAKLNKLSKEIAYLERQFHAHINQQHQAIHFFEQDLLGVGSDFLTTLEKHNNYYKVPLSYDAFFAILENCSVAQTRKTMFLAFNNRVQHANEQVLKKLLYARDKYARLVGYKNFAEYEASFQMVGSVQRAQDFIDDLVEQTNPIVQKEFMDLTVQLPDSVQLSFSGKLYPWDEAFVKNMYRKQHFDIDAAAVAQYFPLSHVMHQLQKQFGQFFALSFDPVENHGLWSKDLICLRVRLLKTSEIIGYLVFDLFARQGKSDHALQMSVIPTIQDDCNLVCSGLSTVVTNFVQGQQGKETLLEFHDVKTLLHEFGHALHELFGATQFVDVAGTKGPRDFVEVPSQLFEMWMDNPAMIKAFSSHVVTKKPLSNEMIDKIIAGEKFGRASLLQRQCLLSQISLQLGCSNGSQDPHQLVADLYKKIRCDVEYEPQDHFETTFDHLVTYGSHYYGYVWSQVLAAGLFEYICQQGISNSAVGQKLYTSLLSHGGSQDPHALIELLLGSTITKQALLHSLQS